MEIREIQAILESVLFAAGDAVELERLADIVDVDKRSLREILKKMMDEYNYERRGIHVIQLEDSYQMCTRGEYSEYVSMLAEPRRKQSLSGAAIEVLAIVAYHQPVTRSAMENIRGVNCDYVANRLMERGLIEEVGRLDAPGRPLLFGTTQEFLRCFGIASLSELPDYDAFGNSEEAMQLKMELAPQQLAMDAETEHLEHAFPAAAASAKDTDGGVLQYKTQGDTKDDAKSDTTEEALDDAHGGEDFDDTDDGETGSREVAAQETPRGDDA